MPEPTIAWAASAAAAASALTTALFGFDHHSLLWGLVGALFALHHGEQLGRGRAIVYVALATLGGAVLGNVLNDYFAFRSKALLIGACLLGGIFAQAVAGALVHSSPRIGRSIAKGLEGFAARWARGGRR